MVKESKRERMLSGQVADLTREVERLRDREALVLDARPALGPTTGPGDAATTQERIVYRLELEIEAWRDRYAQVSEHYMRAAQAGKDDVNRAEALAENHAILLNTLRALEYSLENREVKRKALSVVRDIIGHLETMALAWRPAARKTAGEEKKPMRLAILQRTC